MRKRRTRDRPLYARVAWAGGAATLRLCARAIRRPVDSVAIMLAVAISLVILVNALFLQSGAHPAPFFVNPKPAQTAAIPAASPAASRAASPAVSNLPIRPSPMSLASQSMTAPPTAPSQQIAVRRNDPIAELIGPSPRIAAVQRALSDYGYGQLKPSGMLDEATSSAIEKFEREHKLPITGRVSERLVSDLVAMVGHPLE